MTDSDLPQKELIEGASLPGRPGIYFVGPYTTRITFYSQQVRALRLARALHERGDLKESETIAVVGAGAAGATISIALALLGHSVVLYDQSQDILHLQSGSTRLLHPHIYEWPQLGSLDDKAGLPIMDWIADSGSEVVLKLRKHFSTLQARLADRLTLDLGFALKGMVRSDHDWTLSLKSGDKTKDRAFSHVFLTMGFGDERPCGPIKPEDYWKPGAVGTSTSEAHAGTTYVVSGNGDGALTVFLGLLIRDFDHVEFTREFLSMNNASALRDATGQVFVGKGIDVDVESDLRARVLPVLEKYGVIEKLQRKLRKDRRVTVNSNGPLFSAGRASQLNQCMVLAVLEAANDTGVEIYRSQGFVTACEEVESGVRLAGTVLNGVADCGIYSHAILRHGPDINNRYGPVGELIGEYQAHVKALMASDLRYSISPSLDNDTFDLFEARRIEHLSPPATLDADLAAASARKQVIEVSLDSASNWLVERGCLTIADVSAQCENLPIKHFIDLYASPARLADAAGLVRLARSSNNKIELRACGSILQEWLELDMHIAQAPPRSSVRRYVGFSEVSFKYAVDQCLMRLLDRGVEAAAKQGGSQKLGFISSEILDEVSATWSLWKISLNADADKRFDFLRWLANVDQTTPKAWDGNEESLINMINALIMIAATHSGEQLSPDPVTNGNLTFGSNGVVVGSGAEVVGIRPLSLLNHPDDWGADALILAAASDVSISDSFGTVQNAGRSSASLTAAQRIRPAIVQRSTHWLKLLSGPLADWQKGVAAEFADWRRRQDAELAGVD
ncbi:MAG: ABC-three component system protein [Stenotrophomonas sp.]